MNVYQQFLLKKHPVRLISDFRELVYGSAEEYGKRAAFVLRERTISYGEFRAAYRGLCTALLERGYGGSSIAVIGANSYGWILGYLAAASIGTAVPIDKELSAEDVRNFIEIADCTLILGDEASLSRMDMEDIETFVIDEVSAAYQKTIFDLVWEGERSYVSGSTAFDTMPLSAEQMHVLIFTSGTTGQAKGVCLSQKNICANINAIASMVKVDGSRHALSVLPLHHTYESTIGHLLLLSAGGSISYCDGLRHVGKNLTEYSPSVIIAVPLLLEFMLRAIEKKLRKELPKRYTRDMEQDLCSLIKSLPLVLRKVVRRKVRKSLGGRLKLLIVGAAAVKPAVIEAFELLGITTYQGYGLTECAPLLAGNNDFCRNIQSVGVPIHGVEIKIEDPGEDGIGEIMARGDNIMLGYYNDPAATAEAMKEGFFHTGDLGRFDDEGFLYITGRCKNVIVTRNGKNIYPEELEIWLMEEELVEEAIVIGAPSTKKDDLVAKAKIFPCFDRLKDLNSGNLPPKEEICQIMKDVVDRVNDKLPAYKRITMVEILWEPLEKTTTKKIKRFGSNTRFSGNR